MSHLYDAPNENRGLEFLLVANFFLPPQENNLFFVMNVRQFFFTILMEN